MKILLIGNPIAGGGRAPEEIQRLDDLLRRRGHNVEIFTTKKAGDAAERAATIDPDVDRLLVVGGDGTLNEVLNGLKDPSATPIALLPMGTANILANELELPFDSEGVADLIDSNEVRRIDLGHVGPRRFLMVVSAGFDAMVTKEVSEQRDGKLGYSGYLRPFARTVGRYSAPELTVRVDDHCEVECAMVIATNTRTYGGLFTVSDHAAVDSGHLDVCMFTLGSAPYLISMALAGLVTGITNQPGVTYLTGQRVQIEASEPVPFQIDGDYAGETPTSIDLYPRQVPIVVSPSGAVS